MTTTTTTTNTGSSTAPAGFWKRLWQSIRRLFKREHAGCCASGTTSGASSGQETKATA
ncbi:MAG: hypothetical protein N3I86_04025 [Verrucomicrobiae bacterium]|nr:hypothetical protein [Verrucomicrobiae bacterium]MDW8307867.1 hypothetical protein [Verrucomicrobiales bacterium]